MVVVALMIVAESTTGGCQAIFTASLPWIAKLISSAAADHY